MKVVTIEAAKERHHIDNNYVDIKYLQQSNIADNDRDFFKPMADYLVFLIQK